METLFKYLATFNKQEAIIYFVFFCSVLALFPYYEIILKYFKYFIVKKELKIISFNYSTKQHQTKANKNGTVDFNLNNSNNLLICNSIIHFAWEVQGARKVDLFPIKENIKGNTASLIINEHIKKYELIVYGFNGESIVSTIDLTNEIFYHVETNPIASNQKIVRPNPQINSLPLSKTSFTTFDKTKLRLRNVVNFKRYRLNSIKINTINYNYFIENNTKNSLITNQLEKGKILKSYTFSTKKYNSINIDNH